MPDQRDSIGQNPLTHAGELEMRRRFPGAAHWDEGKLSALMRRGISPSMARFLEAQSFFFIATADHHGRCDCSFRGREYTVSGRPLPALKVLDAGRLIFPDFSGNGLYNSLGNIQVNPQIGMLFVDFDRQRRARVNGAAAIHRPDASVAALWPMAQAYVEVRVEQAYGNCAARIPRMQIHEGSDMVFR